MSISEPDPLHNFKSFPVEDDAHLLTVLRYVERNPLRAGIVRRAETWRWSSLGQREREHEPPPPRSPSSSRSPSSRSSSSSSQQQASPLVPPIPIADWPVQRRSDWLQWVNRPQTAKEEQAVLRALTHDRPFGSPAWTAKMEKRLGLGPLRGRGRPKGSTQAK